MTGMKTSLKERQSKAEETGSATQADLADLHGVTPLMHAAALGNTDVVSVMMEYNRSGTVTIDMSARDDNGNTAFDHAVNLGNTGNSNNNNAQNNHKNNNSSNSGVGKKNNNNNANTKSGKATGGSPPSQQQNKSLEIQGLLQSHGGDVAGRSSSPTNHGMGEAIELADMSSHAPPTHGPAQPLQSRAFHGSFGKGGKQKEAGGAVSNIKPGYGARKHSSKSDSDTGDASDGDIQKWAEEIKSQHEAAGRVATLASPSVPSMSRPGSKQSQVKSSRSTSSLSVHPQAPVRPGSPRVKVKGQSNLRPTASDEDEDEDISLQSLSELVGTVRQYAMEIREIYAPIQKEEEERVKKKRERAEKRRNKELNKAFAAVRAAKTLAPPNTQEVHVEIHQQEDTEIKAEGRGKPKPRGPAHSKSMEPSPSQPLALLHVENEQLSSTWPRGRPRSQSSERTLSENNLNSGKRRTTTSFKGTSSSTGHSRPQIPSDWNEQGTLQHERDILNKAFKRMSTTQKSDPLLSVFNKTQSPTHKRLPQQMQNSRQSVIQVAKEHQMSKQSALPSISIIPPPVEGQRGAVPGGGSAVYDKDVIIPTGNNVTPDESSEEPIRGRQSKNGGAGVKSSAKAGLRRRKSVDQGMGPAQNVTMDKY